MIRNELFFCYREEYSSSTYAATTHLATWPRHPLDNLTTALLFIYLKIGVCWQISGTQVFRELSSKTVILLKPI